MEFGVVTLFPDMVRGALSHGVLSRAIERGRIGLACENPREHASDVHRTVDARPFGGGPGMVMTPAPLGAAIRSLRAALPAAPVVALSPQGERFDQRLARRWAAHGSLVLVAGRYEGIDERVMEHEIDEEVSLGDFVLSGGEFAALAVIDAVSRLVPGRARSRALGGGGLVRGRRVCSTARTGRGRKCTRGTRCPRCCCRAITRGSPAGDASARSRERGHGARSCSTGRPWTRRTRGF